MKNCLCLDINQIDIKCTSCKCNLYQMYTLVSPTVALTPVPKQTLLCEKAPPLQRKAMKMRQTKISVLCSSRKNTKAVQSCSCSQVLAQIPYLLISPVSPFLTAHQVPAKSGHRPAGSNEQFSPPNVQNFTTNCPPQCPYTRRLVQVRHGISSQY